MAQINEHDGAVRKKKKQSKSEDEKFPTGQMITLGELPTYLNPYHGRPYS